VPYLLGVDIGSGSARAAVCRRVTGTSGWGPPEPVPSVVVPAAVSGLFRRCGDDVPVFTDELFITPQALLVEQARGVVDQLAGGVVDQLAHGVVDQLALGAVDQRARGVVGRRGHGAGDGPAHEPEAPDRVALAYPTTWGAGRVRVLRAALDDAGMSGVVLVTRARAVVERHLATGRHAPVGQIVAVCRVGRLDTEVSLFCPGEGGRLELLAALEDAEVGGDDLADGSPTECRAVLGAILDLFRRSARSGGVTLGDLAAVLLAGGGVTRTLVAETLAEAIAAPVLRETDPRHAVACGAAVSLRPPAEAPATGPVPAVEPPILPTDLLPVLSDPVGAAGPGAVPPRPPLHVSGPEVRRR
jgi:hypothetical protein